MHISERLPRESSRDYALRIIKDNIISLRLEPGSQISENELATEMGPLPHAGAGGADRAGQGEDH